MLLGTHACDYLSETLFSRLWVLLPEVGFLDRGHCWERLSHVRTFEHDSATRGRAGGPEHPLPGRQGPCSLCRAHPLLCNSCPWGRLHLCSCVLLKRVHHMAGPTPCSLCLLWERHMVPMRHKRGAYPPMAPCLLAGGTRGLGEVMPASAADPFCLFSVQGKLILPSTSLCSVFWSLQYQDAWAEDLRVLLLVTGQEQMPLSGQFGVVSEITNGALPGLVEIGGLLNPSAQDGGACSQEGRAEGVLSGHRGMPVVSQESQTMSKGTAGPQAEICFHSPQDH